MDDKITTARGLIASTIDDEAGALRALNLGIHSHPETAYQEHFAHDLLCDFLEQHGFTVTRHTYGLETSFEAEIGTGGRLVVFCAEYDALPGIGHGCGHNLIATSSLAAFVGLAKTVQKMGIPGRVRILGTPAEEGGGGKVKLIEAGAFKDDIAAAIMSHPTSSHAFDGHHGLAGFKMIASHKLRVEYHGKAAHAAGEPWDGINALDAAVAAYNNISMLRQQIRTDERIHGVIEAGGDAPNIIPQYTRMNWNIRSPNAPRAAALLARAKACFEAAGAATGCTVNYIPAPFYKDLVLNDELCEEYVKEMSHLDRRILVKQDLPGTVSSDMGNVSYEVPSFHGVFGIPTVKGTPGHHPEFAKAAETELSHKEAIVCSKAMAMLGWKVLAIDEIAELVRRDFELAVAHERE